MKIITSMIPFVNYVGAFQLLTNVKSLLEKNDYVFDIFVLKDNKHYDKLSKSHFSHSGVMQKNINYVSEKKFFDIYNDDRRKTFFNVNVNICTKYSRKTRKQEVDNDLWINDRKYLIEPLKNKNIIWFEHGPHSNIECNYEKAIKILQRNNNEIIVWSNNTSEMDDFYKKNNIKNFVVRQIFSCSNYKNIKRNETNNIVLCFNSRYVTTKRPGILFKLLEWTLHKDLPFEVHFRGNKNAPFLYVFKHFFDDKKFIMNNQVDSISDIYDSKDFCFYFGNNIKTERGKIEYALLEPIYYEIPVITSDKYFDEFMYDEYSITKEQLEKCLIRYSDETFNSILNKTLDTSSYVKNAKEIIFDKFSEENIMKRIVESLKGFKCT